MVAQVMKYRAGNILASGIALAVALTWAATEPRAQNAQPPGESAAPEPGNAAPAEEQEGWMKICSDDPAIKKTVCIIQINLVTDAGQFLASTQLRETEGEARKRLIAAVPPGMLLQPGLQVQVDKNKPVPLQYSICFPNACYGEAVVEDAFINAMKKGSRLMLTALNEESKPRPFPFTLGGFTAVYDGPGIDPNEAAQRQRDLQQRLSERAEEERRRLEEQQGSQEPKQ